MQNKLMTSVLQKILFETPAVTDRKIMYGTITDVYLFFKVVLKSLKRRYFSVCRFVENRQTE